MIDHIELQTRQLAASLRFYTDVLAPLGYRRQLEGPPAGFGVGDGMDLFLVEGEASANVHFAFGAKSRRIVDEAFAAGKAAGHELDREPALAPHIHPNYYAGFLRDPDGRLIEIVCHAAE